jgi:hypothetical protein
MIDTSAIRDRLVALAPRFDERGRRSFAAAEARSAGYGGIAAVARATGIAASTIGRGLAELAGTSDVPADRNRRAGGGRKAPTATNPALLDDLLAMVSPSERGGPMPPLRWTCKGLRRLASELRAVGHKISHAVVDELLKNRKFGLPANSKIREGDSHPDRDAQFSHINASISRALAEQQPMISVEKKKKELAGDFKNAGREWRPQGDPEQVRAHDFLIKNPGRAVPCGIYDLAANAGWVSVGIDHDTAEVAVRTIRTWWHAVGCRRSPDARHPTITADGGGSNGSRVRLWKREPQKLANELGIDIHVHHLPPGTSKWNKIERRGFSFISTNRRARPLASYRAIIDLISATTTATCLTVACEPDTNTYPKRTVATDQEMAQINILRDEFHGEWNCAIRSCTERPGAAICRRPLRLPGPPDLLDYVGPEARPVHGAGGDRLPAHLLGVRARGALAGAGIEQRLRHLGGNVPLQRRQRAVQIGVPRSGARPPRPAGLVRGLAGEHIRLDIREQHGHRKAGTRLGMGRREHAGLRFSAISDG